jgi:hypothetical protein
MRFLIAAMMLVMSSLNAQAADKMTLILDWFINPDHGPDHHRAGEGVLQGPGSRGGGDRAG